MKEFLGNSYHIIIEATTITFLVIVMMIFLEYLNTLSNGRSVYKLKKSPTKQLLLSTLLGAVPGCGGGFAVVSLYSHKIVTFGALCAAMIASCGDESLFMISLLPSKYLMVLATTIICGFVVGYIINLILFITGKSLINEGCKDGYEIHDEDRVKTFSIFKISSYRKLKYASRERIIILSAILTFITILTISIFLDNNDSGSLLITEGKINIIFLLIGIYTLLKTATTSDHFIKEHIFKHIVKQHLLQTLMWSLGALIVCNILLQFNDIERVVNSHTAYTPMLILLASIIGIIPTSGPHLIFVILAFNGTIPLYILTTNMIAQQGHVSLPLLSHNRKSWFYSKIVCCLVAIIYGYIGYTIG